ncbi:asparaginyl/glutamyl-tRNA amidotransferase subunit C [Candidatus Daviesbacteria bacterium RIFCSPHIGHO2_01_FULL_40_11]|uniref:Aspartyl/glutamyl-tRNA(Asn/Gln) amidotransferase subunit C n=1 Tax=Candidatus Daviesbacteria bacterium RIFCSPHIGHO2_01_FULL_40_11 TaxID=1797762 RepID=A0A1F5JMA4_9BACT|nr:MAG: asparaginyl/glutamyl-tRNA amidotransferase subunit C [Candidatus Daviesbacteria bacterium RIFCSPHIGHO2_01_FULL_40_11]OGE63118.1 MAG: asparaginyl/glutamyl-tRNA amidotransferase subunit C [Candidatus Daviesbacteria bacterium RIFCSPLOWO2_01_FULL_40_27]
MKLTRDQVKHVARLADLPLTDEEEEKYSQTISKILDYVEQLNQVDTSDVEPTFNVTGQNNVFREDTTDACLSQEEVLSNAPKKKNDMFETKGVFEKE